MTLQDLVKIDDALFAYTKAIDVNQDFAEAYENVSQIIENLRFDSYSPQLYPVLIHILTAGKFTQPIARAKSILSHDPLIKELLAETDGAINLQKAAPIIWSLDALPLLNQIMQLCPLPDLPFERCFVGIRRSIKNPQLLL